MCKQWMTVIDCQSVFLCLCLAKPRKGQGANIMLKQRSSRIPEGFWNLNLHTFLRQREKKPSEYLVRNQKHCNLCPWIYNSSSFTTVNEALKLSRRLQQDSQGCTTTTS